MQSPAVLAAVAGWQLLAGPRLGLPSSFSKRQLQRSGVGPGLALDTVLSFTGTRHTLGTLGTRQSSVFWVTVVSLGISLQWVREAGGWCLVSALM